MADVPQAARPRLFTPSCIGNVELKNRVVMPSMTYPRRRSNINERQTALRRYLKHGY